MRSIHLALWCLAIALFGVAIAACARNDGIVPSIKPAEMPDKNVARIMADLTANDAAPNIMIHCRQTPNNPGAPEYVSVDLMTSGGAADGIRRESAEISAAESRAMLKVLWGLGLLQHAMDDVAGGEAWMNAAGPRYFIILSSNDASYWIDLGWDIHTLRHLEVIRRELNGPAAVAMDKIFASLKSVTREWEYVYALPDIPAFAPPISNNPPATRAEAIKALESAIRRELPKGWSIARKSGKVAPFDWTAESPGDVLQISQPPIQDNKYAPLTITLMEPGYAGRNRMHAGQEDLPQSLSATPLLRWHGGIVFKHGGYGGDQAAWDKIHRAVLNALIDTDPSLARQLADSAQINARLKKLADELSFLEKDGEEVRNLKMAFSNFFEHFDVRSIGFSNDLSPSRVATIQFEYNITYESQDVPPHAVSAESPSMRVYVAIYPELINEVAADFETVKGKFAWDGKSERRLYTVGDHWRIAVFVYGNRPEQIKKTNVLIDAALEELRPVLLGGAISPK